MGQVRRLAGIYLAIQGASVLAWWAVLKSVPASRALFQFGASDTSLLAFWLPDLLLVAGGSALASFLCLRRSDFAAPVLCSTAGALLYATLYCLTAALAFDSGWLGFTLMAPAALLTFVFAAALLPHASKLFRQAQPRSKRYNILKTCLQIILFWSTLLVLIPFLIVELQEQLGISLVAASAQRASAIGVFLIFSALGLWSGFTMATHGDGTPLPVDSPRRLVLEGPYAWVRNPMAVAGLGQGLAVALFTGSVLVLCYTVLGTLIWQYIVRPVEEEDLLRRFGPEYEEYRVRVSCWLPRSQPYRLSRAA